MRKPLTWALLLVAALALGACAPTQQGTDPSSAPASDSIAPSSAPASSSAEPAESDAADPTPSDYEYDY